MTVTLFLCDDCGKRITKCGCTKSRLSTGQWTGPSISKVELYTPDEAAQAVRDALDRVASLNPSVQELCAVVARDPLRQDESGRARRRPPKGKRREQGRVLA